MSKEHLKARCCCCERYSWPDPTRLHLFTSTLLMLWTETRQVASLEYLGGIHKSQDMSWKHCNQWNTLVLLDKHWLAYQKETSTLTGLSVRDLNIGWPIRKWGAPVWMWFVFTSRLVFIITVYSWNVSIKLRSLSTPFVWEWWSYFTSTMAFLNWTNEKTHWLNKTEKRNPHLKSCAITWTHEHMNTCSVRALKTTPVGWAEKVRGQYAREGSQLSLQDSERISGTEPEGMKETRADPRGGGIVWLGRWS